MLLPVLLLVACSRPAQVPVLLLLDEQGQIRQQLPLADASFSHVFVHSINLSPVDEDFSVADDDTLLLHHVRYAQTSTGMPSGSDNGFSMVDGRFVLEMSRRFTEIPVRVSPVPGHGIRTAESFFAFSDLFNPGDLVILRGRH